jgi:pyruvate dehydrogenase E2 component (dihydrolipoamide acetyltransferase)
MKVEILLPEMGESVLEANIVKWHKAIGDRVNADETLLEVATDKVDSEVPSPVSGKLLEIKYEINQTVKIGEIIAYIETEKLQAKVEPKTISPENNKNEINKNENNKTTLIEFSLPEMGESVLEATITKWHKKVGDLIKIDEFIVDVATDKVDSEIPSPYSGKIIELKAEIGAVVKIGTSLAIIETQGVTAELKHNLVGQTVTTEPKVTPDSKIINLANSVTFKNILLTPLVRHMAKSENLKPEELSSIKGTGSNSRLTKRDLDLYISNKKSGKINTPVTPISTQSNLPHKIDPILVNYDPNKVLIIPMSTMRKGIAKHMIQSIYTAPHVFSVQEVNMKKIWDWRESIKDKFKKENNFNLTITHVIMFNVAKALQKFPRINASIQGDNIIVHKDFIVGMAVGYTAKDGDNGLIVPVIKHTQDLTLLGLAKKANDVTEKARKMTLTTDETKGGTFTVTNVGVFGTEIGLGIINQPQVAILALGAIIKKVVVNKDDSFGIAPMMKMSMSYDHRVVDGMLAGQFLQFLQELLENYST